MIKTTFDSNIYEITSEKSQKELMNREDESGVWIKGWKSLDEGLKELRSRLSSVDSTLMIMEGRVRILEGKIGLYGKEGKGNDVNHL